MKLPGDIIARLFFVLIPSLHTHIPPKPLPLLGFGISTRLEFLIVIDLLYNYILFVNGNMLM